MSLCRNLFDAAESEPVGAVYGVFRGPAAGGPHKGGGTQKATTPHGQVLAQPLAFTHLPHIAAHVIAPIRARAFIKKPDLGGPPNVVFSGIAVIGKELIAP